MKRSVHGDETAFDRRFHALELQAREKLRSVLDDLPREEASDALGRALERRIVPALGRMGFDEQICWSLFRVTAPTWESLATVGNGVEPMNPALTKDLRDVRKGVLVKSETQGKTRAALKGMTPPARDALLRESMDPGNLFLALDDVSLSWIVLPRAYDLLERQHARHLLFYTRALDEENDVEFAKVLARIVVEFLGNYSVKYIDDERLRDQTVAAFFHAYSAMFWRNLRTPPPGLESGWVFDCFLRWAKAIQQRFAPTNRGMDLAIERMEAERDRLFPPFDAFGMAPSGMRDARQFLIALRHGTPGVDSVCQCFGVGPPFETQTYGRLPYASVPQALNALCGEIKRRYRTESPRTRASIREFLARVETTYDLNRLKAVFPEGHPPEALRFVGPRVSGMSHAFASSMHLLPTPDGLSS